LPAPLFPSSFETMSSIRRLARTPLHCSLSGALLGIALLLAGGVGCDSDGGHRDQNYGSDVGASYQLPDGGARDSASAEVVAADVRNDATPDAAPDAGVDAAAEADAPAGASD
jgi:hypothetical protein